MNSFAVFCHNSLICSDEPFRKKDAKWGKLACCVGKLRGRTGFLDPPASYLHSKLILLWPELIEKCFRFWQTQRRCVIVKRTVKKAMWLLHFNNHNKYEFYFFIHSTYLLATQQQIEQKTTQCWTDALHCVLSFFRFTATKRNHSV